MTIDEHIKHIQGTIEWAKAFGGEDDDNLITMWTEQLEMLKELKWYRDKDLILRTEMARLCSECTELAKCYVDVSLIPKVEYGGENDEH